MTALDLRAIARALGGEVSGRRVLAPGPQHSPKDRSLCVSLAPSMTGGFLVHSFAGDDPIQCKDYVRARLGLPAWQPGDEQDRRVHLSRIKDWDRTIADSQANLRERTEDDSASQCCSRLSVRSMTTTSRPFTASASISHGAGRRRIVACSALSIVPP